MIRIINDQRRIRTSGSYHRCLDIIRRRRAFEPLESFALLLPAWAQDEHKRVTEQTIDYVRAHGRSDGAAFIERPDPQRYLDLADKAAQQCDRLLSILSPTAAISAWMTAPPKVLDILHEYGMLVRFRWTLGVSASGDSHDPAVLALYLRRAGRWWAATLLADRYQTYDDSVSFSVASTSVREFLNRTSAQVIRYHWASRMIAMEIGRQIESDNEFATLLPDFTSKNIERCFESATRYASLLYAPAIAIDAPGMELARHMAIGAGTLCGQKFVTTATSIQMESRPWVIYADGLVPIATSNVLLSLDRTLLAAVDEQLRRAGRTVPAKVTKGELFERVAQQCVSRCLTTISSQEVRRPYEVKVGGRKRDVDLAIINGTVQIIGETKAMEIPSGIGSAAASFQTQIGQIYDQIKVRLDALDQGTPVIDGAGDTYQTDADIIGLGVVLHPYSASLADPEMLKVLDLTGEDSRIAVAELHSWVLVLSAIGSIDDLRDYLRFRAFASRTRVRFSEECDCALVYFSSERDRLIAEFQAGHDASEPHEGYHGFMIGQCISIEAAIDTTRPTNWSLWRRQFVAHAESVGNPFI